MQSSSNTEAELDQVLYYDNLGWADERKTLAEDDGGNTNPDNYNDFDGNMDDEESAGNLVTIKGDFISDAAEVSYILAHLIIFPSFSWGLRGFLGAGCIRSLLV